MLAFLPTCVTRQTIFTAVLSCILLFNCHQTQAKDNADRWLKSIAQSEDFWIGEYGPSGPIFSGPQQFPFICTTIDNGLGQPKIDNQAGIGNAVFPEIAGQPDFTADPVGYSRLCSIATRVDYVYFSTQANAFVPLVDPTNVPIDVEKTTINGQQVNFVVRVERGSINRFIYSIAMLAPFPEKLDSPGTLNNKAWNRKLVYKFDGGVGIGHYQGFMDLDATQALHYASLKRGYAVAYSTGTKTGTHYNMQLSEETALMLKAHFKETYGKPLYTVGIGGSGGGIQQYVIAQNTRHVIDAAIPQLSYPDMVTTSIYIGDCELLERYFDSEYMLDGNSPWADWQERSLIEGLATSQVAYVNPWSQSPYAPAPGSSTCINGWRGAVPQVFNPTWTNQQYLDALKLYRYPPEVIASVKWNYWNDLGNIYPQDTKGFAYSAWDNVGVQYGLRALRKDKISIQEFLNLNACIGGWKSPQNMTLGYYPWDPNADPSTFDPWDQRNMNLSQSCKSGGAPAPRTQGNLSAMHAAYKSGQVFLGRLNIPVLDIRYYLEPILDMHHSQASFAARARLIRVRGNADNQVIWIVGCDLNPVTLQKSCVYDPTGDALDIVNEWLGGSDEDSNGHIISNKPASAVDACYNSDGNLYYAGKDAWNGILNNQPAGPCTSAFPIQSTSRIEAGGSQRDDIFKCALKPVASALEDGTYAGVNFNNAQKQQLQAIFPTGVCDYSKGDVGRPKWHYHHQEN